MECKIDAHTNYVDLRTKNIAEHAVAKTRRLRNLIRPPLSIEKIPIYILIYKTLKLTPIIDIIIFDGFDFRVSIFL